MSERKITDELRKVETALRKFDRARDAVDRRAQEQKETISNEREGFIHTIDAETRIKLHQIGVLGPDDE